MAENLIALFNTATNVIYVCPPPLQLALPEF